MQQTAVKLVGATFILLIAFADVVFWIFGTSLLLAIETSLRNSRRSSIDASEWTANATASLRALTRTDKGGVSFEGLPDAASALRSGRRASAGARGARAPTRGAGGEATERGRRRLCAAKRKVKWAMIICAQFSLQGYALLLCSVFTKYGTAAPCVFFGLQMTIMPLLWHIGNIQLHAGRSQLVSAGRVGWLAGRKRGGHGGDTTLTARLGETTGTYRATGFGGQPVVPVERDEEVAAGSEEGGGGELDRVRPILGD